MTKPSIAGLMAIVAVAASCQQSLGALITVSNLDTNDIVVPVFDTSLGTLNSVDLTVVLRAGSTNAGGGHDHATYQIFSTNTRSNTSVAGFTASLSPTTSAGPFGYLVNTPSYSGGGVNLGNFAFSTNLAGLHAHSGTAAFTGFNQVGPSSFQVVAAIDLVSELDHTASYDSQSKNLSFTGGDLVPFLGPSDIVISAGTISTSSVGDHSHTLAPFGVTVSSSSGPWTWQFASSTAPSAGFHQLTLDPRFDTVATFNYTPFSTAPSEVPEPASLALFGLGGLGLFSFRRRLHSRSQAVRGN